MPNEVSERNGPMLSRGPFALPPLSGAATQISWATQIRNQVNSSFDGVATAILSGANRYKGLEPAETELLIQAVEEHRWTVLGSTDAQYFLDHWQDPIDRVQRLINGDERWKRILEARAARNPRQDTPPPLRYMGFDDKAGIRIFKFGRLPAAPGGTVFTVHVEVSLFQKHRISFQDGPALCSAIMALREEQSHHLTDEDCLHFISLRTSKTERPAKRKPAIPPAS